MLGGEVVRAVGREAVVAAPGPGLSELEAAGGHQTEVPGEHGLRVQPQCVVEELLGLVEVLVEAAEPVGGDVLGEVARPDRPADVDVVVGEERPRQHRARTAATRLHGRLQQPVDPGEVGYRDGGRDAGLRVLDRVEHRLHRRPVTRQRGIPCPAGLGHGPVQVEDGREGRSGGRRAQMTGTRTAESINGVPGAGPGSRPPGGSAPRGVRGGRGAPRRRRCPSGR